MNPTINVFVGYRFMALCTEQFYDYVTKGKIYEVVEVKEYGFYIINDEGQRCMPIASNFTVVSRTTRELNLRSGF